MRVTCLIDNAVKASAPYWGEHGLAFLIESAGRTVLLDTGASSEVLLHNLAVARVAPADLDAVALSHGHRDHTGGLAALLAAKPALTVLAHPRVTAPRFSRREGALHEIGMPAGTVAMLERATQCLSREPRSLAPGVWTTGEIVTRAEPEGRSPAHCVRDGDRLAPDPYIDDLSLVLETPDGLVLLCGCCHAGLLNTLAHVKAQFGAWPCSIVGGTHLGSASAGELAHVVERLAALDLAALYPNHCTGQAAYLAMAAAFGRRVAPFPAGTVLDL
jgi:7,8-dihydropterin-6-yl-methyl-4-(beta-D-ribofuranosyl)aminobenzene 5'-phosphate synthase